MTEHDVYLTPHTRSSYDAVSAFLAGCLAVQTPLSPAIMDAAVQASRCDMSPDAVVELWRACETAADAAHRANWSLDVGHDFPARGLIRYSPDDQRFTWLTSVTCWLEWGQNEEGQVVWQVGIDGDHPQRRDAMEAVVAGWAPQLEEEAPHD